MKDTYFFSHDANALSDIKMINMRADYGLEGYGLFWAIIEQLRCEQNYMLPRDKKLYRAIKINTNTEIDVEKYINDCITEYGLFERSDDGKYFYSASLKRRMKIMEDKKVARSAAGKKGAEKRWNENNNSIENSNAIKNNSNAIEENSNAMAMPNELIAKNSKIKENKRKEKKRNNINKTKLNETFNLIINNNSKILAEENQISESESQGYFNLLKRLKFLIEKADILKMMVPDEKIKYKLCYYAVLELYKSSYKVYLDKLNLPMLLNKYEKTREYIGNADEDNTEKLNDYMSYFIRSLQDELEKYT